MMTPQACINTVLNTPYAYGGPAGQGIIRRHAADYIVDEIPLIEPGGEGEHVWLKIRKRHTNTDYVARQLQALAGVKPMAVSYAGLKDRHALTTQWFSVHLPGTEEPDWSSLESDELEILEAKRHSRKLRRGTLLGNQFKIQVRDIDVDTESLMQRVDAIQQHGVPNYFARQRFGHGGENIARAQAMFNGERKIKRHQRSIYLSSVRSMLFNYILAQRVEAGSWNCLQPGDICLRTGKRGFFPVAELNEEFSQRLAAGEIHPTAPLWGQGELPVAGETLTLEAQLPLDFPDWCAGLEKAGLKMERRALRLVPEKLSLARNENGVSISFNLPAGCYATTVIRELFDAKDYDRFNKT